MGQQVLQDKLSGSTDGKPIQISATSTLGNTVHTAVSGTASGTFDQVWLYATNTDTATHTLTIEWGAAGTGDDVIVSIAPRSGLLLVIPGLLLRNGLLVTAFADTTNVINITGFVNHLA